MVLGLPSLEGGEPLAADSADVFGRALIQASIHWASCHLTLIIIEDFGTRHPGFKSVIPLSRHVTLSN